MKKADKPARSSGSHSLFERFAASATLEAGRSRTFGMACLLIFVWGFTGPIFHYSEAWQMVVNTGTTIVTFLMVFLLQQSQNKDAMAVHLKLNELLASHERASNRIVAIENLSEQDLETLRSFYCRLAHLAESDGGLKCSHSIDEADELHERKSRIRASEPADEAAA